jgi:hypothetical protein
MLALRSAAGPSWGLLASPGARSPRRETFLVAAIVVAQNAMIASAWSRQQQGLQRVSADHRDSGTGVDENGQARQEFPRNRVAPFVDSMSSSISSTCREVAHGGPGKAVRDRGDGRPDCRKDISR